MVADLEKEEEFRKGAFIVLQKNWSELIKPSKMEVNVEESNGKKGILTAEPLERGFEGSPFPPCQYR